MKLTITIILVMASLTGFTQGTNTESHSMNFETSSVPFRLELVAKNDVSTTTSVYTYKFNQSKDQNSNLSDDEEQPKIAESVAVIIQEFYSVKGVVEVNFDQATQTFTVVTETNTDLTRIVKKINNN